MLGNRCIVDDADVDDDEDDAAESNAEAGSTAGAAPSSLPGGPWNACKEASAGSAVGSAAATGVGMKNLALPAGFADGRDGDWKDIAGAPPPLLNVSTYLWKERGDLNLKHGWK